MYMCCYLLNAFKVHRLCLISLACLLQVLYLVLASMYLQVESLKVQLNAANREKCHSESTISRLSNEIDRKVHSRFLS